MSATNLWQVLYPVTAIVAVFSILAPTTVYGLPRDTSQSQLSIAYLLGVGDLPTPSSSPPPFKVLERFHLPVQLDYALRTMAAHVREANNTLKIHATEAMSFIAMMGRPSHLERAVIELKREMRHVWKVMRRHQYIVQVKEAASRFKKWVDLLTEVGNELKRAHPAPAIQWLHSVLLNYSDQGQALDQLKTRSVKMVWKAQLSRQNNVTFIKELAKAVGVLSHSCQGLKNIINDQWQPGREALTSLSKPALSLPMTMSTNSKDAKEMIVGLRSSVLNPMNRQLRKLTRKIDNEIYFLLASNVGRNWQGALVQSARQDFLLNLTTSQLTDLKHHMDRLEDLVVSLTSQTNRLKRLIVDMLGYAGNKVSNDPPPVLKEITQLASNLKFFRKPPLISDGHALINSLLKHLRQEIKKVVSP